MGTQEETGCLGSTGHAGERAVSCLDQKQGSEASGTLMIGAPWEGGLPSKPCAGDTLTIQQQRPVARAVCSLLPHSFLAPLFNLRMSTRPLFHVWCENECMCV